ncbi:MAG: RluA family pseudouridine synthase [Treponema sp.]|jgi:23S rRNA pseudouridine955/2504/2580 synthase|nr:RluA family pseudouridine synthase [Treponema sp.]
MKKLEILHENDVLLIINKPAGLAVQGGKGVKSSLDQILAKIRNPPPLLVHRLDKDTSGVILVAKTKKAASLFSRLLGTNRKAVKQYIAVCSGIPKENKGSITEDLLIHGKMKKSETVFRVIKTGNIASADNLVFSILELELGTGRMHQIRRHLALNGTPVFGDDKYGDFALNKKLRKTAGLNRLLLHASRLVINDEINLDVHAPLPDYFHPFYSALT